MSVGFLKRGFSLEKDPYLQRINRRCQQGQEVSFAVFSKQFSSLESCLCFVTSTSHNVL